jgi:hypothetical protein
MSQTRYFDTNSICPESEKLLYHKDIISICYIYCQLLNPNSRRPAATIKNETTSSSHKFRFEPAFPKEGDTIIEITDLSTVSPAKPFFIPSISFSISPILYRGFSVLQLSQLLNNISADLPVKYRTGAVNLYC